MDIENGREIEIFCSYSHEDAKLQAEMMKQIDKKHTMWHDRMIRAGQNWAEEIDSHLNTADVILLFISPDFKASKYCSGIEMGRALEREKKGEARIIPIMLRQVHWPDAPFADYQWLPSGPKRKAVKEWKSRDAAFANIAQGLMEIIEEGLVKIPGAGVEEYFAAHFDIALNNIDRMIFLYNEAIKSASGDIKRKVYLMRNKGSRLFDLGKAKDALIVYKDIIDIITINNNFEDKFRAYIYKERGDVFRCIDLFTKALKDYEMAIHFLPGFAEAIKCRNKTLKDMNPEG